MARRDQKTNIRVEVHPRSPGDFGWVSMSGQQRTEEEAIRACEEIVRDIKRHIDGVPSRGGVDVVWDTEKVCEFCSADWTEESSEYNGSCCARDHEKAPDATDATDATNATNAPVETESALVGDKGGHGFGV